MKTINEVAERFNILAGQEKWFDIQDELFADNVKSIEPGHSIYFENAEGKANVRRKGEQFVSMVEALHNAFTSEPVVAKNYFAVSRFTDLTLKDTGRIQLNEIMLYEVKDGMIISEQFFY